LPEMSSLVRRLPGGPVDVVGDVHGEYGALLSLLDRLGYDDRGHHDEGRRLVFVGDLIDRGPDSIAVVRLVRRLVEAGTAFCIVGNHELNLVTSQRKHGNAWGFGKKEKMLKDSDRESFQMLADEHTRREVDEFIKTLPLALERDDLRVVHAAWNDACIDALRTQTSLLDAYDHFERECEARAAKSTDETERELVLQNENSIKVVTSGLEEKVAEPFYAGGKWRALGRSKWWAEYHPEAPLVVFGHYWRKLPHKDEASATADSARLFAGVPPEALLGHGNSMCVDFSIGKRFVERAEGVADGYYGTGLAALRLPEKALIFHDGRRMDAVKVPKD